MLSEMSQRKTFNFTYMCNLKQTHKQMNKQNEIETDPQTQRTNGQERKREMGEMKK